MNKITVKTTTSGRLITLIIFFNDKEIQTSRHLDPETLPYYWTLDGERMPFTSPLTSEIPSNVRHVEDLKFETFDMAPAVPEEPPLMTEFTAHTWFGGAHKIRATHRDAALAKAKVIFGDSFKVMGSPAVIACPVTAVEIVRDPNRCERYPVIDRKPPPVPKECEMDTWRSSGKKSPYTWRVRNTAHFTSKSVVCWFPTDPTAWIENTGERPVSEDIAIEIMFRTGISRTDEEGDLIWNLDITHWRPVQ